MVTAARKLGAHQYTVYQCMRQLNIPVSLMLIKQQTLHLISLVFLT